MNKIIEIVRLIFNLHLGQYESIEQVKIVESLIGLYKFTFQQIIQNEFDVWVNIWSMFIEDIKIKDENGIINKIIL
jgi:hypothetical protein